MNKLGQIKVTMMKEDKTTSFNGSQTENVEETSDRSIQTLCVPLKQAQFMSGIKSPQVQKKTKRNVAIAIGAVILVIVLIGGAAWFMLANNTLQSKPSESSTKEIDKVKNDRDKLSDNEPTLKDEVVALNKDDKLVRRLHGNFRDSFIYIDYFLSEGLSDSLMMRFAAQNIATRSCAMSYFEALEKRYADDAASGFLDEIWQIYASGCYSGDDILFKIEDMFGKTLMFEEGMNFFRSFFGGVYEYSAEYDEFYPVIFHGGGAGPGIVSATYAAEMTDNHVLIYDVAGYDYGTWDFDGVSYKLASPISPEKDCADDTSCRIDYVLDKNTILEHIDDYTKFKWTFVWNGENYVFESLEKI